MKSITTAVAALAAAVLFVPAGAVAVRAQEAATTPVPPEEAEPEVVVETLKDGEGDPPPAGSFVLVNYKGMLTDGTVFDANERVPMDLNGVVPGFAQGLMQMKRGGRYRLTIPPELGYGARQSGPIPPNSELIFEVELIDYKTPHEIREMMAAIRAEQEAAARARIEAAQGEAREEPKK